MNALNKNKLIAASIVILSVFFAGCARSNGVICKPFPALFFPGAGSVAGLEIELPAQSYTVDLTNLVPLLNAGQRRVAASIDKVTLKAHTGVINFDFISRLVIDASSSNLAAGANLNNFNIINYNRDPLLRDLSSNPFDASQPGILTFFPKSAEEVNVSPYVDAGLINLRIAVAGEFPRDAWSMDLQVCIGNVSANYLEHTTP